MNEANTGYAGMNTAKAIEPEASTGSLLAELQALDKTIREAMDRFNSHSIQIEKVLVPEQGNALGDAKSPATTPEPLRSEYAERVHRAVKDLRQLIRNIETTDQRVRLT